MGGSLHNNWKCIIPSPDMVLCSFRNSIHILYQAKEGKITKYWKKNINKLTSSKFLHVRQDVWMRYVHWQIECCMSKCTVEKNCAILFFQLCSSSLKRCFNELEFQFLKTESINAFSKSTFEYANKIWLIRCYSKQRAKLANCLQDEIFQCDNQLWCLMKTLQDSSVY